MSRASLRHFMRLIERATISSGYTKYIGGRSGRTYYLMHRVDGGSMVHCRAYLAAETAFEPLREKVGVTSCVMVDREYDSARNNVRVYSDKSYIEPHCRRDGLLDAMYDHLTLHGYVVYPADGSVGDAALQAQSDDAKAFWRNRAKRPERKLLSVSEAEFNGWINPFKQADEVCGRPVIDKIKIEGHPNPALILWQKDYAAGRQSVGVTYSPDRGYRVALVVQSLKDRYVYTDTPFIRDGEIIYYYKFLSKRVMPGTVRAMLAVEAMLEQAKYASVR